MTSPSRPELIESEERKIVRHKKTAGLYAVLHEGKQEATLEPAVVYQSLADGQVWIRSAAEMWDGRFEEVDAPAPIPPAPVGIEEIERLLVNYDEAREGWLTRPELYEHDLDNARRELLSALSANGEEA